MSDIDKIRAWHEANARPTVGFGPRRMFDDIAVLLNYVAVLEAERDAAHAATQEAQNVTVLIYEDRIKVTITDDHDGAGKSQFTFNSDVDVLRYFTNISEPSDFSRIRVLLSLNYKSAVAKNVAKALRLSLTQIGYNVQNSPTLVRSLAKGGAK